MTIRVNMVGLVSQGSDGSIVGRAGREYRVTCFGRPVGGWHPTKEEAERDAVKRKLGSYDAGLGVTFLDVSARIEGRPIAAAAATP